MMQNPLRKTGSCGAAVMISAATARWILSMPAMSPGCAGLERPSVSGWQYDDTLVHDGVMFIADTNNILLALDARDGTELWRYEHQSEVFDGRRQGIALYGDSVFVPHNDLDLVALNVRTGAVIWETSISTPVEPLQGYYGLRGAPMIADGMLLQGVTATMVPEGGFIVGLDLETGAEQWRFHTVARPGSPVAKPGMICRCRHAAEAPCGIPAVMTQNWDWCISARLRHTTPAPC